MVKKFFNLKTIIFTGLIITLLIIAPKIYGLLLLLFASFIMAAALNPYVNKLTEKTKSRPLSTIIILLIAFIATFSLILPIIITGYKEIGLFAQILPKKVSLILEFLDKTKLYGHTISDLVPLDSAINATPEIAQNVLNKSVNITLGLFQTIFIGIALTMFTFYILADKDYFKEKYLEFFPPNIKEKAKYILSNITNKVGNYVRAQIISMIIVGILVTIVLFILKADYAVLLGLITGICEIIPILGPTIAISLIVAVIFPMGIVKVILAIVLFLTIQQVSNYIVRPFLFGKFMKIHPITILVALFIAQEFLGIWGVILSPAIASTICVLIDELYLSQINEKENSIIEK